MLKDRAQSFLQMIRRSQRGRLKIYLGYGPGVGKTFKMLSEGQRLKSDGIDVVVGIVETHGRIETAKLAEGLETVLRHRVEYHGITIEEMDIDAILARKPQVVLVDELAHTNSPDSRNPKRYQDVQELQAAGIHVIATMNVQHLESLYNAVEKLLGVKVRERVPDSIIAEADEVVNVDLSAEDLQRRLREGKVYPKDRIANALHNFFTQSNLQHLRELTLREVASQLDFKRRQTRTDRPTNDHASEQVMVCLSSRGPNSAHLLRYGSRLAGRLNRNWYAVYVQTPSEDPAVIDSMVQRLLADTLTLANQLGATVFTFKGQDIADTILRFAREYRVDNIVVGRPQPLPWWRCLLGQRSVADQLIRRSSGMAVIVVDAEEQLSASEKILPNPLPAQPDGVVIHRATSGIGDLLTSDQIVIWDNPATRGEIFQGLANAITGGTNSALTRMIVARLDEREKIGSTFFNEGVALPHARIDGLEMPKFALGLTHGGVLDAPAEVAIDVVFMLLSPPESAPSHLQILAQASRMLQSRELRRRLRKVRSSSAALEELRNWEQSQSGNSRIPTEEFQTSDSR